MSVVSGPERVERRLAAFLELLVHVDLDLVHRHVAGALDHHLAALAPRDLRQLAERFEFGELRAVVGVRDRAGAQPVAERERHVILAHQVADLLEALVEEALLVARQAPLRHDRAAARHDAGDAVRGERHVGEPHAGVDGEIVDALFALLDQRVLVDLPVELDRIAVAPSPAPGRSARCRSAPASCAGSIRACCGCCGRWRGPSRCRRPSGSPTPSSPLPPRPRR